MQGGHNSYIMAVNRELSVAALILMLVVYYVATREILMLFDLLAGQSGPLLYRCSAIRQACD